MPENRDTDPRDRDEIECRKDILVQRLIEYLKEFEEKDLANVKEPDFHRAARENRVDIARRLFERGDHVNARNEAYATALLFERGYDVNARIEEAYAPALHVAVRNDSIAMVSVFIQNKADVNIRGSDGTVNGWCTALHVAVRKNSIDMARLLVKAGADVNAIDNNGHTPLYFAALNRSLNCANTLLAKGAHTSGIDMDWWSQSITQTEEEEEYEEWLSRADEHASLHQPNIQDLTPLGMRDVDIDWGSIDYERRE
jgi:ankyrin repeat protein